MDDLFSKLQESKVNNIKVLVGWIKDAEIDTNVSDQELAQMFNNIEDKNNVSLDQFKGVLDTLASNNGKTMEEAAKMLTDTTRGILAAIQNASGNLKGLMGKLTYIVGVTLSKYAIV